MWRNLALGMVAALFACADESSGALGQAGFGAGCKEGSACVSGIGAPLAVGAVLPLVVELHLTGSTAPPMRLEAVTDDIFRVQGFAALGLKPGLAALYVVGPRDLVIDFIHLWVERPDRLEAVRRNSEGVVVGRLGPRMTLLVGDEVLFSLEPVAGSQQLLGDFPVEWAGGDDVVRVLPAGVDDWQRLVARAPGTAALTATAIGLTLSFEVEVLP